MADADVLIENFRPGTLEEWGVGWDELARINPGLVMLRISGFGQTGPYRDQPGFGAIGEAMGGLRHMTGEPGRVPVRVGVSIGDTLAALHGAIGVLLALYHRKVNGGRGQVIDVALYEAVFNCMESLIPEYSAFGAVREAAGSALPGIAPTNAYRCRDGYVLIAGNGDSIFRRLMDAIGRPDLGAAPDLASNSGRVARVAELDAAIEAWTKTRSIAEVLAAMEEAHVPVGRVYTAKDIAEDPHYRARDMILEQQTRDGYSVDGAGHRAEALRDAGHGALVGAASRRRHRCGAGRARILGCGHRGAPRQEGDRMTTVWDGGRKRIHIQEVGTRDGFQVEAAFVPTADKIALVNELSQCGPRQDRGDRIRVAEGDPGAARRRSR